MKRSHDTSTDNERSSLESQPPETLARLFSLSQMHQSMTPLALKALTWDSSHRSELKALDNVPPTPEDDERMRTMTLDDVWHRAVTSAHWARFSLRNMYAENTKGLAIKRGQRELQFWRERIAALDDALLGLAFAGEDCT